MRRFPFALSLVTLAVPALAEDILPDRRVVVSRDIDFFGSDQVPIDRDGDKNQDHFCMVIEPTDMEELKTKFEAMGVGIQAGPVKRWGSHGDGISLYIYDPDDNVVELRHY